jgi:CO/xanthine dehydrogenase Mo-binding subunit
MVLSARQIPPGICQLINLERTVKANDGINLTLNRNVAPVCQIRRAGCLDAQMVLADGKVLFQNQEVAFVVAESREAAADAVSPAM